MSNLISNNGNEDNFNFFLTQNLTQPAFKRQNKSTKADKKEFVRLSLRPKIQYKKSYQNKDFEKQHDSCANVKGKTL